MTTRIKMAALGLALVVSLGMSAAMKMQRGASGATGPTVIKVDVAANRHPISDDIYGASYNKTGGRDINAPFDRWGGNNTSRYNPFGNADNKGGDWYFESIPQAPTPFKAVDDFVIEAKGQGSQAMVTVPMLGWVAKVNAKRTTLGSYSTTKYGAQAAADGIWGNGVKKGGGNITGNDPNDANIPSSPSFMRPYVEHLVSRFGTAAKGGVRYYLLDNEPGIWYATHRDVMPEGITMEELATRGITYATMIKKVDPTALVVGPEEWGWPSYIKSSYDLQKKVTTDQAKHGGMEQMAFLLSQFKAEEGKTGKRLLDVFSLHFYPQGGEYSEDVSQAMQLRRNRSTRALWDPDYKDETWINKNVRLIPRMKEWVANYYPGTKTAITEYNWGGEKHINGATTQADILGIFGREGLDVGARWTKPFNATPTYKAFQMYRNYDGKDAQFGNVSVACAAPNPDELSAFASEESATGAVKVMVISKVLSGTTSVTLNFANFAPGSAAEVFQLTAANKIDHLPEVPVKSGSVSLSVPAQSITLLVIAKAGAKATAPRASTRPPRPSVPATPSNLAAAAIATDRVRLTWKGASKNESGFTIQRSEDGVTFGPLIDVGAGVTTFENKQLLSNQTYYYRVRAVNTIGKSEYSNVARAKTLAR